jgi:hypothetical protein
MKRLVFGFVLLATMSSTLAERCGVRANVQYWGHKTSICITHSNCVNDCSPIYKATDNQEYCLKQYMSNIELLKKTSGLTSKEIVKICKRAK